ncbi:hypothetical protein S2M10_29360 [Sphingomonas sp. S2M10]|uniref:hypothetical protein n=1 Tax=Sphingomonas sp. S2M10 TaxID=2705010 RepID=UPI0014574BDF|nr:hypothetical protein [Sphingomonas sp. S2M10]NLS27934.1 hypothetical protein [Sphingomonas sp. S2M10]
MANSLGTLNPNGRLYKHASGTDTDAAVRRFRNRFNLATDADAAGGTTNGLFVGTLQTGQVLTGAEIASSVSLAAVNFTLGTIANPTLYGAAQAGPAANAVVRLTLTIAAYAMDAATAPQDLYLFPSANLPATGQIVAAFQASHR